MAWSWIFDGPGIAKEVKNATQSNDNGANRECPKCKCRIDNSDVSLKWPGLPAGVKFDPSDAEIIEHLAAKCGIGNSNPHAFIDEFIPTLDQEKGICYTHPKNLPGAKKDGTSIHFFHKTTNAYATGQRKRRKIQSDSSSNEGPVRWHKTGKTKPVMDSNGVQRGFKKIMVLYKSSKKGFKPDKSKWVVHQYHLGADEDEKEGEYVVSKVLYQQHKQDDNNDDHQISNKSNALTTCALPRTPNPNPPNPPRRGKSILFDDLVDDSVMQSSVQVLEIAAETSHIPTTEVQLEDDVKSSALLAGESQALENSDFDIDDALLCRETINSSQYLNNSGQNPVSNIGNSNQVIGCGSGPCSIADLENLEFDSPPDFTDLHFGSQDSLLDWINLL